MSPAKAQAHKVEVFGSIDGQYYWSCATCETAGKPVKTMEAAQEGADQHAAEAK